MTIFAVVKETNDMAMEQKELSVNIDYLIENGLVNYTDGDMVLISNTNRSPVESTVRLEMVTIAYVESGMMQCDLNGKTIKAGKGDIVVCSPNSFVDNSMSSADFSSKIVGLSYKAMQRSLLMSKDVWNLMAYVVEHPVIHLSDAVVEMMNKYHALLSYKLEHPHGYYHREIMQSLFHCMFYELAAIISPLIEDRKPAVAQRQGELLFRKFIKLLSSYEATDRSVKGYAEKLCVTPKYLSTVCKSVSGKTALEWIHDFLADSITHKLKYTDVSIKEIADELGFPNISFFGKFVKSRFGVSPKEYRIRLQNGEMGK